jgi:hypothetical protein
MLRIAGCPTVYDELLHPVFTGLQGDFLGYLIGGISVGSTEV